MKATDLERVSYLQAAVMKTVSKKLEDANYYGPRTIMNIGKRTSYESILRIVDMNTSEHRRME